MADAFDDDFQEDAAPAPKKKKKGKKLLLATTMLVILGGGGGGFYAWSAGMLPFLGGGAHAEAPVPTGPRLVPKSEQKRLSAETGEEGHKTATPTGTGGEKYASNYYPLDKEFTSNLKDSIHFVQMGIAVSTPYDDTVIDNLKTNEIAVRSSILMALGDATEDQVFTSEGKRALQVHIAHAINDVLKEKEGFGGIGNVYFTTFVVQ